MNPGSLQQVAPSDQPFSLEVQPGTTMKDYKGFYILCFPIQYKFEGVIDQYNTIKTSFTQFHVQAKR